MDSTVSVEAAASSYGTPAQVSIAVAADDKAAIGSVAVYLDGKPAGEAELTLGSAAYTLPATLSVGTHKVTAEYLGNSTTNPSEKSTTVSISKATTVATLKLSKTKATTRSSVKATVSVKVPGTTVVATGKVQFIVKGKVVKTVTLTTARKGKITATLPKFKKAGSYTVTAKFVGTSSLVSDKSSAAKIRVTK